MDVSSVIADLLSANLGPDPISPAIRRRPNYGVQAALFGENLTVSLAFQSEATYCCMEWGCHLSLLDGKRWHALRKRFAEHGLSTPERFHLSLTCSVESGALSFDFSQPDRSRRGWYAFKPSEAYEYNVSSTEACEIKDG